MRIRKDIENLKTILLSVEKLERNGDANSIQTAENLDALYTALKSQAKTVIENEELEAANETLIH